MLNFFVKKRHQVAVFTVFIVNRRVVALWTEDLGIWSQGKNAGGL